MQFCCNKRFNIGFQQLNFTSGLVFGQFMDPNPDARLYEEVGDLEKMVETFEEYSKSVKLKMRSESMIDNDHNEDLK
jgi:hypothetical protein